VDPDRLISALWNWIPELAERELRPAEPAFAGAPPLPGLDTVALLDRLNGNGALLLRLLGEFARKHGGAAERIRESLARNRKEEALRAVHSLKGVSGNMCALEVFEASKEVEAALRGGTHNGVEALLAKLDAAMRPLVAAIMLLAPPNPPPPAGRRRADKPESLVVALNKLDALLARNSFSARVALGLLRDRLQHKDLQAHVQRMEACLARLDYGGARVSLAAITGAIQDDSP
jgi:HPt (histidine-containing phosphotransfer) domain-containing protein